MRATENAVLAFTLLMFLFAALETARNYRMRIEQLVSYWNEGDLKKFCMAATLLLISFGPGGHYFFELLRCLGVIQA
jgi:hypothetical protein